jgi:thiol-disulfide isomerase/thioredoxin
MIDQEKQNKKKTIRWKRELIEWGIMLSIFAFIYLMGWHTEVIGRLQQGLLWTGLIQAETELDVSDRVSVNYDMPLISLAGEPANLEDFRGKVVFLNFWATWCPPCIAEMPGIQKLYEEYGNREDMVFVMITLDEDIGKARQFLDKREFTFGAYQLSGLRPEMFRSEIIPTTYVIDKSGKLVSKKEGMASYNTSNFKQFLDRLLDT